MALYGVSITKQTLWRGNQEQFSNVYHYNLASTLDVTLAQNLIDQLETAEKLVHTNNVDFLTGRVWEAGGSPAANETILIADLTGSGSAVNTQAMYKELAVVCRIDTARNTSTGRKIYLRKYIHSTALNATNSGAVAGTGTLTAGNKTPFETYIASIRELSLTPGPVSVFLAAPGGQQVSDSSPSEVLDYLHIRQFRQ
jgi:hypothetical protein